VDVHVSARVPPVTRPDPDRDCVERLRGGDTRAIEELYDRHNDLLYSLVRRIVGIAAEAEDVVQETWLHAWRTAASFDPARGSVVAWLVTIARSRAIDRIRSEGSRRRTMDAAGSDPQDPPPPDPSVSAAERQRREQVGAALAQLSPQHRQVLDLAYFGGLSQAEIATRMAAPLGTVKSWTRQALNRLSKLVPREDWL
jgi:RNA polymerase sigma-70 factor (ECF subfamily)